MFNILELIESKPLYVGKNENIFSVIKKLNELNAEAALVKEGSKIIGAFNLRDLINYCNCDSDLNNSLVGDLNIAYPEQVPALLKWEDFIEYCRTLSFPLLVVDKNGGILGCISINSLNSWLINRVNDLLKEIDAIIDYSDDWLFIADGNGIALRVKAAYEKDFGMRVEDVVGKSVEQLENEDAFHPSVTSMVLKKKKPQAVMQVQRDGRKLLATGTPVFNDDGGIFRVIVNVRDITHLNDLKNKLEEAERLKELYYKEIIALQLSTFGNSDIICSSPQMAMLLKIAKKVAATDSTVLITGETGVGKGLIAKYIHECSDRKDHPFVVINCGAIPENLLESELFGYVRGAFSGAHDQGKIGKMELADKGTLFFDEISELPLNLQVKLLQAIQEQVINRVGDTRDIKLDIRFIAATNRNLLEMVKNKQFREDLYFRINVVPLEVPPLRSRVEDIEPLARFFLEKATKKYSINKKIDSEVFESLRWYNWPGNVRELENLIERLCIVTEAELIQKYHLPPEINCETDEPTDMSNFLPSPIPMTTLEKAKEALEVKMLRQALAQYKSTYKIAKLLGVNQSTVVRKIKKYNL